MQFCGQRETKKPAGKPAADDHKAAAFGGDDDHCSLTGGGATNPISNWTQIIAMDSAQLVPLIIKNGRLPPGALPTFMHEMAHHWCFHSPVGAALAMAQLRAQRSAVEIGLRSKVGVDDLKWSAFYDTLRFDAANALLRPLSEGLALFAEFDAIPGASSITSTVTKSVGIWFCEPERMRKAIEEERLIEEIGTTILRTRMTTACYKLKTNLLSQPMRYDLQAEKHGVRGGYLLGYLALKNIRIALMRKGCDALQDTDLFLTYVRSYIFDDYGLVARLLASASSEMTYLEELVQYLRIRLLTLVQETTPGDIARFETLSTASQDLGPNRVHRSPLHADSVFWREGREVFEAMEQEVTAGDSNPVAAAHRRIHQWMLARRAMACVANFKDIVKVSKSRVLTGYFPESGRLPSMNFPSLPGVPDQESEGLIQCFIVPDRNLRIVSVSLQGKAVAVMFDGSEDEDFKADFLSYELDGAAEATLFAGLVDAVIADLGMDAFKASLVNQLGPAMDDILSDLALMFVPDNKLHSARATLAKGGFYAVLDNDFQAFQALATASVVGTMMDVGVVKDVLQREGQDFEGMLKRCGASTRSTGIPTIKCVGKITFSAV